MPSATRLDAMEWAFNACSSPGSWIAISVTNVAASTGLVFCRVLFAAHTSRAKHSGVITEPLRCHTGSCAFGAASSNGNERRFRKLIMQVGLCAMSVELCLRGEMDWSGPAVPGWSGHAADRFRWYCCPLHSASISRRHSESA
jgi:hypothetical protein